MLSQAVDVLLQDGMEDVSDQEQALEFATRAVAAAEADTGEVPESVLSMLAKARFRNGDAAGAVESLRSALRLVDEGSEVEWEERLGVYEGGCGKSEWRLFE